MKWDEIELKGGKLVALPPLGFKYLKGAIFTNFHSRTNPWDLNAKEEILQEGCSRGWVWSIRDSQPILDLEKTMKSKMKCKTLIECKGTLNDLEKWL